MASGGLPPSLLVFPVVKNTLVPSVAAPFQTPPPRTEPGGELGVPTAWNWNADAM